MTEIYREVLGRLDEVQLFDTLDVKLVIRERTDDDSEKKDRRYFVDHFETDSDVYHSEILTESKERIDQLNDKLSESDWNIFYVFKELFQILGDVKTNGLGFNYFRGQRDNWELRPGIARPNINNDLIRYYDYHYSEIAEKFPHDIKYIEYDKGNIKDRAEQLAILQHYGFHTSLLDITSNPYIALEFMISGASSSEKNFENSTFNFFLIDPNKHNVDNVFTTVKRNDINVRLTAQEGAFLNFDALFDIKTTKIKKIQRVAVELVFDEQRNDDSHLLLEGLRDVREQHNERVQRTLFGNNSTDLLEGDVDVFDYLKSEVISRDGLDSLINDIKNDIAANEKRINYCFLDIQGDIRRKLSEYYYLEEKLYPDFPTYISYQKNKFIESTMQKNYNL
ncbi:FRG domain-containing protein [Weissella cibaria]|uniref:FRG domain-containing protein n=1 Tax=Weissella cibaria TaxID=137591 RepID=UPI00215B3ED7|nr:FRG domain-containing protein [Weissella cibaria]MCR8703614.1 FRG domain-containing protein [Weissella cibaria]